jgi:hypothetical protein
VKANERLVYFFEMNVSANKQAASAPAMADVMATLEQAFRESKTSLEINKQTATVEIVDLRIDDAQELATLFVRYSDKNGADVYFANPVENSSRVERKRDGEGRAYGAHLTISLKPRSPGSNVYATMLEKANGLSSTIVVRLLQSIFRTLYKADQNLFTCDDISGARTRDGKAKQVGFRPMLALKGLPSDQFISDLQDGTLKEIQLIEEREAKQVGARPWLVENQRILKLEAQPEKMHVANMWDNLKGLFAAESKNGFGHARIKFRRADGEMESVDVDAETGGLLDHKYVKAKRIIDIKPPLDECADGIVEHFATLIEQELVDNR